jgi:hypothetical protein
MVPLISNSKEVSIELEAGHTYLVDGFEFKNGKQSFWTTEPPFISSFYVKDLGSGYRVPSFADPKSARAAAMEMIGKGKVIYVYKADETSASD